MTKDQNQNDVHLEQPVVGASVVIRSEDKINNTDAIIDCPNYSSSIPVVGNSVVVCSTTFDRDNK